MKKQLRMIRDRVKEVNKTREEKNKRLWRELVRGSK